MTTNPAPQPIEQSAATQVITQKGDKAQPEQGKKPKDIDIEVNGRPVTMTAKEVTGLEIKQAAVDQKVSIQLNFVLQLELANGSSQIIGDTDQVRLHEKLSFTAIAPDDNS